MKNNTPYKIIGIALTVAGIIAGVCLAYGALNNKVETQDKRMEKQDKRIEKVETKADANENVVIRIETKIEAIESDVKEVKRTQRSDSRKMDKMVEMQQQMLIKMDK